MMSSLSVYLGNAAVDKWYKKWYYAHARDVVKEKNATVKDPVIEYIPTREFYHRYVDILLVCAILVKAYTHSPNNV